VKTYDQSGFEKFCGDLVVSGFSPVSGTDRSRWTGPIRASLAPLTAATRMQIVFYPGWPLRYAHVLVEGIHGEHVGNGLVCLWAEDDPAQVAARDFGGLLDRIDEWAAAAVAGFEPQDRALDAFMTFEARGEISSELPFADLLRGGGNGYIGSLVGAVLLPAHLTIRVDAHSFGELPALRGAFYVRNHLDRVPRTLDQVTAALTNRQRQDLTRRLEARADARFLEPSGGIDFVVVAWPRHELEHDALVLIFEGTRGELATQAILATPSDLESRERRAGRDATVVKDARVLVAGAGSIGGYLAAGLAASGVGALYLRDNDTLRSGNVVRHLCGDDQVGMKKTAAVAQIVAKHAPWTQIVEAPDLPIDPDGLAAVVSEFDLVVDCTGTFSVSAALAHVCNEATVDLITVALFHQGRLARVQRQSNGDVRIAGRNSDGRFEPVPPGHPDEINDSFLELGCTAPINNAPPTAAIAAAVDATSAALDLLSGRKMRAQERFIVFEAMDAPFDSLGTIDYPSERVGASA
jgi:molybdopterin/thiamine biosynthesis adenylyltransferase